MKPLVVVGDTLLDRDVTGSVHRLCPDAPVPVVENPVSCARPGGAGLAAVLARRDGREVLLVTALADDERGRELAGLLAAEGIEVIDLGTSGTTVEKVRIRAEGRSLLRVDRGETGDVGALPRQAELALRSAAAVLVADYGRGVSAQLGAGSHTTGRPGRPVVWDPHPRGAPPARGVTLATPNAAELDFFLGSPTGTGLAGRTAQALAARARWQAGAVAVTLGARGALLVEDDEAAPLVVPAPAVPCFDPCGAGDRFAATAAGLLADGALPSEAVARAVLAASAFVAAGGAAGLAPAPAALRAAGRPAAPAAGSGSVTRTSAAARRPPAAGVLPDGPTDAAAVAARVRAAGGTVVATGGCFDLLHAGHVGLLTAARSLGDCLLVLLNSDASVTRLKGPGRPLNGAADRAAVLTALGCVDAVEIFEEDTPVAALQRLRPDIWAKGGDYALADLPEAEVVAGYGGQAVVLPYLDGRSTTALVQEAARHVHPAR